MTPSTNLCTGKTQGLKTRHGSATLPFPWCSTFRPEHFHSEGGGKSLVSDAIKDFLTHLGQWFSNVLKAQFPFSSAGFIVPPKHWQFTYSEGGKIHSLALEEMSVASNQRQLATSLANINYCKW